MGATLYFDGACEPNPGIGAWGFVLDTGGGSGITGGGVIDGTTTNNVAEYTALGKGLLAAKAAGVTGELRVLGDSMLVVRQMNGTWECKSPMMAACRDRAKQLVDDLAGVDVAIDWIPREENEAADAESRKAWEAATGRTFPERRRV